MFLYLDSIFAEGHERIVRPLHTIPPTLAQLYLMAMREHRREGVVRWWSGERWEITPDWRFDRQVIRLALFLRERFEVQPGDVVLLAGDLRSELLLAEFAVTLLGAVALTADRALPPAELAAAFADAAPRALLASAEALRLPVVRDAVPAARTIALDPDGPPESVSFSAAVDMGGTLDTAERAGQLRAAAREIPPDQAALRHVECTAAGVIVVRELTQGEVVERARAHWEAAPAARGDRVYIAERTPNLPLRTLLCACVGDGHSAVVLAAPGREPDEVSELKPGKLVAPSEVLTAVLARSSRAPRPRGWALWKAAAVRLLQNRVSVERRALLAALGGSARWIGSSAPLDPILAGRLSTVARLTPLP